MPQLGDIVRGKAIGKKHSNKYVWAACEHCGKERWVMLATPQIELKPRSSECVDCMRRRAVKSICGRRGNTSYTWKGGRYKDKRGYIFVNLSPDDFYFSMAYAKNSNVMEHRLVVAKALGRNLHSWEIVHHKGALYPKGSKEDKGDNRYPENLQLVSDDRHKQITILENKIKHLENRVALLEEENAKLRKELATLRKSNT